MIPYILLPRWFKWLGLILVIGGLTTGSILEPDIDRVTDGTGLLLQVTVLLGLIFICSGRQKMEDEFIRYYRLVSLQWAVVIFIALRVFYKAMAWYTADEDWTPHFQANALLIFYLLLFYYQLYLKEFVIRLFKKERS